MYRSTHWLWTLGLVSLAACDYSSSTAVPVSLSQNALGPLPLELGRRISMSQLQRAFPDLALQRSFGTGDRGDYFLVQAFAEGRLLFRIESYPETLADGAQAVASAEDFDIDLLVITTPDLADEFGIRVGDSVAKVWQARGSELVFGANHHDNFLGKERIYYNFQVLLPPDADPLVELPPEQVSLEWVRESNPAIDSLSWPTPVWD